jgi:hypothetical protein
MKDKKRVGFMESFWILGAGHFGSLAAKRILQRKRRCNLLVVDHHEDALDDLRDEPLKIIKQDAVDFLLSHTGAGNEWIIPAIPEHVAFSWLCQQLTREGTVKPLVAPSVLDQQIPNSTRGKGGVLYTSFATFRCPDDCDEPDDKCTVTGEVREAHLSDVVQTIEVEGYQTFVVRSHQLAPGVGGYRLSVLWRLLEEARSAKKDILVATACRCHGVMNALRFNRRRQSV